MRDSFLWEKKGTTNIIVIVCSLICWVCDMIALCDNITAVIIAASVRTKVGGWEGFSFRTLLLVLGTRVDHCTCANTS